MANLIRRPMQALARRAVRKLFGITFLHGVSPAMWSPALNWLRGGDYTAASSLTDAYSISATLQLGLSRIADDASGIGWETYTKTTNGEEKVIPNHPVTQLLKNPSKDYSGQEFFYIVFLLDQIFGEVFLDHSGVTLARPGALAASGGDKTGGSLSILHPANVEHETRGGETLWYLRSSTGSGRLPLDTDEFIQVARYNPSGSVRGLSKLLSILVEVGGDAAAAEWNRRFFANQNGVPTGVVIPPANPSNTKEERDTWFDRWVDRVGGNRGIGLLPPGFTFQEIGISARDMEFRSLREYSREQILGLIGLPPFLAGVLDRANYANAREQKWVYWMVTITSIIERLTAALNHRLLPRLGVPPGVLIRPNYGQVKALLEDLNEKTAVATQWFAMGLSKRVINERLEMGWSPALIDDYEVGYLPFGVVPVGQVGEQPLLPGGEGEDQDEDEIDEPGADSDAEDGDEDEDQDRRVRHRHVAHAHRVAGIRLLPGASEDRRAAIWRAVSYQTRDLERDYERRVRRHFEQLSREVMQNLSGLKRYVVKDWVDEVLFDQAKADKAIMKSVTGTIKATFRRGGESVVLDLGGAGVSFNMSDPRVAARIAAQIMQVRGINRTIERQIRETLGEAVTEGETIEQMIARIGQVFDFGKTRSRAIATTEVGKAFSGSRFESMSQNGIEKHQWLSSRDAKVRDDHVAEDGNIVTLGEPFPVTGLIAPLDPGGAPEQVIQCRCVALPEVS